MIECGYFTDKTVIDLINQNLEGRERESAEQDPSFKQVIPYLIIKIMMTIYFIHVQKNNQKHVYIVNYR